MRNRKSLTKKYMESPKMISKGRILYERLQVVNEVLNSKDITEYEKEELELAREDLLGDFKNHLKKITLS